MCVQKLKPFYFLKFIKNKVNFGNLYFTINVKKYIIIPNKYYMFVQY